MSESANTPTVVVVHGGFADASFWVPVIKDLQAHDLPVLAPRTRSAAWRMTPSTSQLRQPDRRPGAPGRATPTAER